MTAPYIPIIKEKLDVLLASKTKYLDYINSGKGNLSNNGKLDTMYDSNWTDNF
jgi:hypothetical protein